MKYTIKLLHLIITVVLTGLLNPGLAQTSVAPPPSLGQDTKGSPAVAEPAVTTESTDVDTQTTTENAQPASRIDALLGQTQYKESRGEGGQIYEIELSHSSGSKQVIRETDSDGKIESTSNDLEETPNLPKWRIGSW